MGNCHVKASDRRVKPSSAARNPSKESSALGTSDKSNDQEIVSNATTTCKDADLPSRSSSAVDNEGPSFAEVDAKLEVDRHRRRLSLSRSAAAHEDHEVGRGVGYFKGRSLGRLAEEGAQEIGCGRHHKSMRHDEETRSSSVRRKDDEATSTSLTVSQPTTASRSPSRRRLSVSGALSRSRQGQFQNKKQEVQLVDSERRKSTTTSGEAALLLGSLGIGYACKKGLKPESPNQDDFCIIRNDDWALYGVFDGHGPYGHDVSNFVQRELPQMICNDRDFNNNPKATLQRCFNEVQRRLLKGTVEGQLDATLSGSTATIALLRPSKIKGKAKLIVAHVGDSRAVLARRSSRSAAESMDLTVDHKPNNHVEFVRIVNSGGQVRRLEGDVPFRVFLKNELYPGLAMSRALGDTVGAQAGVTSDPDVSEFEVTEDEDIFFLLCSDGVWEFISSEEAVQMVMARGFEGAALQSTAEAVARESWDRWIAEEGTVVDDITVQLIALKPFFLQ